MSSRRTAARSYSLTWEQKLSVGVLGVCGTIALLLSFVQVRRTLTYPFTTPVQEFVDVQNALGPTAEELDRIARRTDSDGDGISDYDELNVYITSPYLRDSDSDGEPDNIEIAKGEDPNCPKGNTCIGIVDQTSGSDEPQPIFGPPPSVTSPGVEDFLPGGTGVASGHAAGVLPDIPERDPDAIRAFLQASGISASELSQYSDEQVLEAYDQSLAQVGSGSGPRTGIDSDSEITATTTTP